MVLEDRNEMLAAMFPPVESAYAATGNWASSNGFRNLGADALFFSNVIDLSGYTMEDLTFATFDTMYQDPGVTVQTDAPGTGAGSQTKVEVIEMVTDFPFDEAALTIVAADMGKTVPGMLSTTQDFRQIIYGRYSLYVPNTTLGLAGYMQMISAGGFGSKEPTAAAKLYCYKIIKTSGPAPPAPGENLTIPACRIGLSGRMFREDDLSYMMRLKRSYELQQLS